MAENYKLTYGVDIVLCIDATESMDPILDSVKENAQNFYRDFFEIMKRKNKRVDRLRVRVVCFRDYLADGRQALLTTDFFELPAQINELDDCIRSIEPKGGGDAPEDGLEALAFAIKSKWNNETRKKRHVIVLWSDDATHEIGHGKDSRFYPEGMARSFEELSAWWGNAAAPGIMDNDAKRLILFTPDMESWSTIRNNWNYVIHSRSDKPGVSDKDYMQIMNAICNTV